MTKRPFRFTFFLLMCLSIPLTAPAQTVNLPDANLHAAIEKTLGKAPGDTITTSDMATLTRLEARKSNISDLTGLEHAINLTSLDLTSNSISDISAVAGLTNLTSLDLDGNLISDISALAGLTNLRLLNLSWNSISDISVLVGLINLTSLDLSGNSISDISALAGLINLTWLNLNRNNISDISAVAGLTKLTRLYLDRNSISDLSALVPNAGLGSGDTVNVKGNPLSAVSIDTHIPALQGRGVTVEFDNVVDIPDSNLRNAIAVALSKAAGDTITTSDMATLTHLTAVLSKISDLTGLEHAINLTKLDLTANSISDISAVAGLTNLRSLDLNQNLISDFSAVAGLTNLRALNLNWSSISDFSMLAGLINLTWLGLRGNSISDISVLAGLTKLRSLDLSGNSISDLSVLVPNAGLGSGDTVNVKGNPLSAVSIDTHIPALQSRGVTVSFDDRAHPALLKISGDNQHGIPSASLSQPFVIEVRDENGSALAGISVTFAVIGGGGTLSTTITRTDANGRAQSTLTLGANLRTNTVQVSADGIEVPVTFHAIAIMADVNRDGVVNILDLVSVASEFGDAGTNLAADISGDGVVNILDLVLVAGMFGDTTAAPSAQPQGTLTAVVVQQWLNNSRALDVSDPIMKRGLMMLEQFLVSLTPTETELLANYPNPFNPETWIPYRLAEDAFVTLTIYDLNGHVVRTLDVGHRIAAVYEHRSKAIYWDGRNEVGEGVASGVYFYHLSAGDYSATRKMVILK